MDYANFVYDFVRVMKKSGKFIQTDRVRFQDVGSSIYPYHSDTIEIRYYVSNGKEFRDLRIIAKQGVTAEGTWADVEFCNDIVEPNVRVI